MSWGSASAGAVGGYVGAKYGPAKLRRWLDAERTRNYLFVLLYYVGLLVLCLPIVVLLLAELDGTDRDTTVVVVFLVGTFALVVACVPTLVTDLLLRWWWARHRRPVLVQGVAPSGAPATVVTRSTLSLARPLVLAASLLVYAVAMTYLGVREDALVAALPWTAVGVWIGSGLVPLALGRARVGGVFLTPDGVEHVYGTLTASVPWTYLEGAADENPYVLPLGPHGQVTRSFPWGIGGDPTDRAPRGSVSIPRTYLALPPPEVAGLLATFMGRADLWKHLGTAAVLTWPVGEGGMLHGHEVDGDQG